MLLRDSGTALRLRRLPTPAQLGYRARLNAQDTAHFARQRGLKAYNARRRAEALARADSH